MSISPAQMEHFAKFVMTHEALPVFRERVQKTLFNRFRTANPEQREVINAIMDNETLFFKELTNVLNSMAGEEDVNDPPEKEAKSK